MLAVVVVAAVIVGSVYGVQVSKSVRRSARNIEEISEILKDSVLRPLSNIPMIMESTGNVLGWVQQYISKDRRKEDDES